MKILWNNIENDLNEVLDPHFHGKKYEKMIFESKKNEKIDKDETINAQDKNKPSNFNKKSMQVKQNTILENRKKVNRKTFKERQESILI